MLATFSGNVAFTTGATGGVVLAGGVTRHISPFIADSNFIKRFRVRGHGTWFMQEIPVRIIKAHFVALYGAAEMVLSAH
jgi:glucokinase